MIAVMSARVSLAELGARLRRLRAGEVLFRQGDAVRRVFQVASGRVRLLRHLPQGRPLVLQRAGEGDLVAEASLFADRYGCDAEAEIDAELRVLGRDALLDALAARPALALALTAGLAREIHALRARVEIASLPRVADRLDAWLALDGERGDRAWKDVAAEIGVSPEALYRERARRRAAGRPLNPGPCRGAR
jgi:CRP-like cAMP-binding protein